MKRLQQSLSILISYTLIFVPLQAANIQTDGSTNTTLDSARNGVPVVNIVNPNSTGLSHNKFKEYNVATEGLILNNSRDTTVNTQLGGYIYGNSNLNSNAKVILNEVTSTSRSQLNGYTEVAGKIADLVIANPNGLTVNGAGFINTSNVTLTTGTPLINNGAIDSFNVLGGDISVEGDGLDTSTQDSTKIYTHYLKVNAAIHAKNLDIKLGKLDSSVLGGMYADRISLVGTDQGLGVNLPPEVLASSGDITITNDGRISLGVLNAQENITISSNEDVVVSDTVLANNIEINANTIDNRDTIVSAKNNLNLKVKDITNEGVLNAANRLTVEADNLTNQQTIFSSSDMDLYVKETLHNTKDANIYAIDNLTLSANPQNAKTLQIINDNANIQTLNGDIDIWANNFINQGSSDIQYTTYYYNLGNGQEYTSLNNAKTLNLGYTSPWRSRKSSAYDNWTKEIKRRLLAGAPLLYDATIGSIQNTTFMAIETRLDSSTTTTDPSLLESGHDLSIHVDDFLNRDATVVASNDIRLDITNSFLNSPSRETVSVSDYKYHVSAYSKKKSSTSGKKYKAYSIAKYITLSATKDATATSLIQAGNSITGTTDKLVNDGGVDKIGGFNQTDNQTIAELSTQIINIPTDNSGLFVQSPNLESNYLIETNPEFVLYENFISSDYMMEHIDYDAEETTKRLGDAFYENTLIRDAVFAQTGRRFLNADIKNNNDQFKYLMDNAIEVSEDLQLRPGISLDKEQINALTKDIVWMEEQIVQGEKVLVPVVYIANIQRFEIQDAKIIAGKDINLDIENLENSGSIIAGNQIDINAKDSILNSSGVMSADNEIRLLATNDITNTSGTIKAKNIDLTSTDGSIINQRATAQSSFNEDKVSDKTTMVGNASNIQATNTLNLNAKENILVQGSELNAKDINLNATNVDITTTVAKNDFFAGDSKNYVKEQSTTHLASNINAENININSDETTTIQGSNLNAAENINVKAKEIDILAVNNTTYSETKKTSKGFLKKSTTTTKKATSTNQASTLSGANVELTTTQESITAVGSNLNAKESLALNSAKDININAGYNGSMDESHTKKSGFFSGGALYSESEDLEGQISKTAVNSTLSASNIQLNANNSIDIVGVDIGAKEILNAEAQDISILNATNTEETYSKHKKLSVGLGDAAKTLINPIGAMELKDGKASFTLAEATYDDETKRTKTTTVAASNINANNINLNATSQETDKGNILVQGSNLNAEEEIGLTATSNITIKEAKETTDTTSKETHGKAELKLTVKNEYVQIKYSLEAVKEATSSLKQTKTDYSNYKKELSSQEDKLTQLKQDYKNGVGFIELGDVEEFEELVSDFKEDDAYYKANIALATTTLATKTTALAAQTAKAANSSGTYGFNAGLELDIDAIEKQLQEYQETSVASNLNATNININAGSKATIQGSNLNADKSINIDAKTTDILASKDISNRETDTEHQNINLSLDMYSGANANISADKSKSSSDQLNYTNAVLNANNININTKEDTTIQGLNLNAAETLTLNTTNLNISSVQNTTKTKSDSKGASAGFGADGLSSVGVNSSNSRSNSKETLLTSVTASEVNINVEQDTKLKGATIAALNADGEDNGNLNLTTDTLTVSSLNNTYNSNSKSLGVNLGGSVKENTASNVSLDYSNDRTNTKTKTLATLGTGNIQVANAEDSDTKMLNRDTENNTVDIYDISSHKGLKGELDTRLLTEDGRKEIAKDVKEFGKNIQTVAQGLPEANSDNAIIANIGKGLDYISSNTGGLIPSNGKNGGLLGNIPVMLGDKDINHKVIQVVTADSKYAKNDKDNFMAIEESDYFKSADEKTQESLKGKGLLVSINPVTIDKTNATYQNFTNGMLNNEALAIKNAIDQTGSDIVTINYNPTHGLFGDALESGVDKAGLGTTGIAKQTGEFINDATTARGKDGSNFAAHSQANILTKSGIEYQNNNGGFQNRDSFIDPSKINKEDRERGIPTFGGYGSPVNTDDMDKVISKQLKYNYTGMYTNPNDAVGEFLGNNVGDNGSNPDRNLLQSTQNVLRLFDVGGESSHSTYKCDKSRGDICGDRP